MDVDFSPAQGDFPGSRADGHLEAGAVMRLVRFLTKNHVSIEASDEEERWLQNGTKQSPLIEITGKARGFGTPVHQDTGGDDRAESRAVASTAAKFQQASSHGYVGKGRTNVARWSVAMSWTDPLQRCISQYIHMRRMRRAFFCFSLCNQLFFSRATH